MNHKKWYSSIKKSTKRREFIKRTWGAVFGRVRSSAFLLPPLTLRDDYRHYLWLKHFFSPLQFEGEKAVGCFPSACSDCCLAIPWKLGPVEERCYHEGAGCRFDSSGLSSFRVQQAGAPVPSHGSVTHTLTNWQPASCECECRWIASLTCFRRVINCAKTLGSTSHSWDWLYMQRHMQSVQF